MVFENILVITFFLSRMNNSKVCHFSSQYSECVRLATGLVECTFSIGRFVSIVWEFHILLVSSSIASPEFSTIGDRKTRYIYLKPVKYLRFISLRLYMFHQPNEPREIAFDIFSHSIFSRIAIIHSFIHIYISVHVHK